MLSLSRRLQQKLAALRGDNHRGEPLLYTQWLRLDEDRTTWIIVLCSGYIAYRKDASLPTSSLMTKGTWGTHVGDRTTKGDPLYALNVDFDDEQMSIVIDSIRIDDENHPGLRGLTQKFHSSRGVISSWFPLKETAFTGVNFDYL